MTCYRRTNGGELIALALSSAILWLNSLWRQPGLGQQHYSRSYATTARRSRLCLAADHLATALACHRVDGACHRVDGACLAGHLALFDCCCAAPPPVTFGGKRTTHEAMPDLLCYGQAAAQRVQRAYGARFEAISLVAGAAARSVLRETMATHNTMHHLLGYGLASAQHLQML